MKVEERIALLADSLRHLYEVDHVELEARIGLEQRERLAPHHPEAFGADARRKLRAEQRAVVIAQLRAEPAKAPHRGVRFDGERQNAEDLLIRIANDHDCRQRPARGADVTMPVREPFERLKDRIVRSTGERLPLSAYLLHAMMDAQGEPGAQQSHPPVGERGTFEQRQPIKRPGRAGELDRSKCSRAVGRRRRILTGGCSCVRHPCLSVSGSPMFTTISKEIVPRRNFRVH
jgi:hypothetical protein